ncbi:MAG: hypothetical protein ACJA01_002040 [Saprospiraceae bacterium]|jgi:hypothetical protein
MKLILEWTHSLTYNWFKNKHMFKFFICLLLLSLSTSILGQSKTENVFLITLDGLRWEELFGGAVDSMMLSEDLTKETEEVLLNFGSSNPIEGREKLMPFFWSTIAKEGQLYGNRWVGNKVNCTNRFWFSYPGYNEILTGYSDPTIDSNDKIYNPNITVLEWLNKMTEYQGRVAAFGSWDVFPYIINDRRSGIPVNAGFRKAQDEYLTYKEQVLNELQDEIPRGWSTVRWDAFTHHYMMEYVKKHRPKVVYISYGETDDFAHDGRYDHYLNSAHQTDQWIADIWSFIESDPYYSGKTSLLITTDHGRGNNPMSEWKSHGTIYKGSNAIWIAALGPDIAARGMVETNEQLLQSQVAATLAAILGLDYKPSTFEAGTSIKSIVD